MPNLVFQDDRATKPMSLFQLTKASKRKCNHPETDMYDEARLEGAHCRCNGDGAFILLPKGDKACVEGGKRYMTCRKCNGSAHL